MRIASGQLTSRLRGPALHNGQRRDGDTHPPHDQADAASSSHALVHAHVHAHVHAAATPVLQPCQARSRLVTRRARTRGRVLLVYIYSSTVRSSTATWQGKRRRMELRRSLAADQELAPTYVWSSSTNTRTALNFQALRLQLCTWAHAQRSAVAFAVRLCTVRICSKLKLTDPPIATYACVYTRMSEPRGGLHTCFREHPIRVRACRAPDLLSPSRPAPVPTPSRSHCVYGNDAPLLNKSTRSPCMRLPF